MRSSRDAWLAAVLVAGSSLAVGADDRPWVEVKSPRFVVVSHSGEGAARDLAWQFEQVHAVFSKAYPWAKLESGRPFVVLAVRNESSLRELSPAFWNHWQMRPGSAYVSASGQDFVALRTDIGGSSDAGENPYSMAYEGYVSVVLDASFPGRLPFWFKRGLQDFFGNTLVRQKDVHLGRLIKRHLERLNSGSRYSLAELMAIDRDSPSFRKEADRQVFEAQAWLFVHYLFFGEDGANLPRLNRYADLLRAGRPGPDAFREAFGELAPLENGFDLYLTRKLYRYTQINLDVNVDRAAFRARPVGAPEALALKAAFALAIREPAPAAQTLAERALQADPKEPLAHEVLGLLADTETRSNDARAELALAVDNGSLSFWAHYRLAQLLWKAENDRATLTRIASLLEKSAQLNPDHVWSHDYLANTRVDLDDAAGGEAPARRAVKLAPGEARPHRSLARVLGMLKQFDAAQSEGGRALALSKSDEEKRDSREMLAWLARSREASTQPAADAGAPAPEARSAATDAASSSTSSTSSTEPGDSSGGRTIRIDKHPCEMGDVKVCRHWLASAETACASGSLEACSSAGWAYSAAPGITPDPAKAGRLLEKACAGGHPDGCVNLAVNLVNRGRPEDRQRAMDVLAKTCAAGHKAACGLQAQLKGRK